MKRKFVLLLSACLSAVWASVAAASNEDAQLTCLLEPSKSVSISSVVQGVVTNVAVERGDIVKKGDLLIELDSSVEGALLALAEERAKYAERELNRNREMIQRKLLSDKEADEVRTNYHVAQMELQAAQFEVARRSTKSPIDGIVFEKQVEAGEFVNHEPIFELVSIDPLHAEVLMRVEAFGKIRSGMKAVVALGEPINQRREGKVGIVDTIVDPTSSTFRVRIEIPNQDMKIPSGLTCEVVEFSAATGTGG